MTESALHLRSSDRNSCQSERTTILIAGCAEGTWRMSKLGEKSFPTPGTSTTSSSLAKKHLNEALELEKQLRNALHLKSPLAPGVRELRISIRESYETVILEDQEFAEAHDVEQALWRLHYRQIEEFRSQLQKCAAAAAAPSLGANSNNKSTPNRESAHKISAAFKGFLSEASGFYHDLVLKLRAKHGLPQDYLPYEGLNAGLDEAKAKDMKRSQFLCHRILIYLGDLARYKEQQAGGDQLSRDWSVPANYYIKSISLWPSSGNPHNQLAVLATYAEDEILAVYRYFRSLAVNTPFPAARDNLILLFEKNRKQYAQILAPGGEKSLDTSKVTEKKIAKGDKMLPLGNGAMKLSVKDYTQQVLDPKALSETRRNFRLCFIRLNGILFTRTSMETFAEVYSGMMHNLEQLLAQDESVMEAGLGSEHWKGIGIGSAGAAGVVQLISILVFSVHNVNWDCSSQNSSYAAVLQRSALFQHAFTAVFEFAGRLMRRCSEVENISSSPLLSGILVFLEWLASRPEMVIGSDVEDNQAIARSLLWCQCASFLNTFLDGSEYGGLGNNNSSNLESPHDYYASSLLNGEGEGGTAIWEDYELQGFVPLAPAHQALSFTERPSRVTVGDEKGKQVRMTRILAAGKAIASALEGSGKGILFVQDRNRFFQSGDKTLEMPAANVAVNGHPSPPVITTNSKPSAKAKIIMPKEAVPREEEEEEVIVFKPFLTETAPNHAHLADIPPTHKTKPLLDTKMSEMVITGLEEHTLSMALSPPPPSHPFNASVGIVEKNIVDDTLNNNGHLGPTSALSAAPAPEWIGSGWASAGFASFHPTDWSLQVNNNNNNNNNLPTRKASSAGIIGQPKQPMISLDASFISSTETPVSSSTVNQALVQGMTSSQQPLPSWSLQASSYTSNPSTVSQVFGSRNVFPSTSPLGAISASTSFWSESQPVYPTNDKTTADVGGFVGMQTVSPVEEIKTTTAVIGNLTNGNKRASKEGPPARSAMRPPPGFGPIPIKPQANDINNRLPNSKPLEEIDELQFDDYSWLDGYAVSKPKQSLGGEHRDSLYGSGYGIWSSGSTNNPVIGSNQRAFPLLGAMSSPTLPQLNLKQQQWVQSQHHQPLLNGENGNHIVNFQLPPLQPKPYVVQQSLSDEQEEYKHHQEQLIRQLWQGQHRTWDSFVS